MSALSLAEAFADDAIGPGDLLDAFAPPGEARRVQCLGCSVVVLEVPLCGGGPTILVEVREFLLRMRCPECRSGRQRSPERARWRKRGGDYLSEETYFTRDLPCWRCGALPGQEGWVGEELPGLAVGISAAGSARPLLPGSRRAEGEAIHRAHSCLAAL